MYRATLESLDHARYENQKQMKKIKQKISYLNAHSRKTVLSPFQKKKEQKKNTSRAKRITIYKVKHVRGRAK